MRRRLPRVYGLRQAERGQIRRHRSSPRRRCRTRASAAGNNPGNAPRTPCHRLAADAENSREKQGEERRGGQRQSLHPNAAETAATTGAEEKTRRPTPAAPTTERKTPATVNKTPP
jgi:hypothetical protein